ncbi:MAG: hypothetical protein HPY44_07385 [Armatimonadetes bacterium]|nr:hypothetical protein [Armatimonadota bacterium]
MMQSILLLLLAAAAAIPASSYAQVTTIGPLPVPGPGLIDALDGDPLRSASQVIIPREPFHDGPDGGLSTCAPGAELIRIPSGSYFSLPSWQSVRFRSGSAPGSDPVRVILSNDPERVPMPRLLSRSRLRVGERTHFMWHHLSEYPQGMNLVVRLRNQGYSPAVLDIVAAHGGPTPDEIWAGHVIMRRFLGGWQAGQGFQVRIGPGDVFELSRRWFPKGHIAGGMADLCLLEGSDVILESLAQQDWRWSPSLDSVRALLPNAIPPPLELPGVRLVAVTHEVGKAWQFVTIGKNMEFKDHPALRGDYGVVYKAEVTFENPNRRKARLEVALRAGGGVARGAVIVNGKIVETGLLSMGMEHILFDDRGSTAPRTRVQVRLIPQAGSNYPVSLVVRSVLNPTG